MTRWLRRFSMALVVLFLLALAALLWYVYLGGGDEPPPQDEDLIVPEAQVPDSENGYVPFREAVAKLVVLNSENEADWPAAEEKTAAKVGEGPADRGKAAEPGAGDTQADDSRASAGRAADNKVADAKASSAQSPESEGLDDDEPPSVGERFQGIASGEPSESRGPWDAALARAVLERNRAALELLAETLRRPRFEFPRSDPFDYDLWPSGGASFWDVCAVLRVRSRALLEAGDGAKALDATLDIVRLGHALQRSKRGALLYGRVIAIEGLKSLRQLLEDPRAPPDALIAAAREVGKYLVTEATRHALEALGRPFAERKPFPGIPPIPPGGSILWTSNGMGRLMVSMFFSQVGRVPTYHLLQNADVAATAVLLAMRAFRIETGRLPAALDELVPKYLDRVPADPFDGKPLRYSAERKVVYSIGVDLEDSGGVQEPEPKVIVLGAPREWEPAEKEPAFAVEF